MYYISFKQHEYIGLDLFNQNYEVWITHTYYTYHTISVTSNLKIHFGDTSQKTVFPNSNMRKIVHLNSPSFFGTKRTLENFHGISWNFRDMPCTIWLHTQVKLCLVLCYHTNFIVNGSISKPPPFFHLPTSWILI